MYNNYQQQQQYQPLIADPRQQTVPAIAIQPGNPPFRPQVQCPGELQPYFDFIVTGLMLEIQEKCTLNSARMYAFNLMAANGFATNEFVNIAQLAVNYIDAMMRTSRAATIEQCINDLIPDLVGKYCLALCEFYPDLLQFLDPNTAQHVNAAIGGMQQIANLIAQVQGQMQNGGVQQQFIGGRMTGTWPTQATGYTRAPVHAQAVSGSQAASSRLFDAAGAPQPTTGGGMMHPDDNRPSRYALQAQRRQQAEQAARTAPVSSYRSVSLNGQPDAQVTPKTAGFQPITRVAKPGFQQPQIPPAPAPTSVPQPAPVAVKPIPVQPISVQKEELVWRPSDTQPHRPVFDFTKFKSKLVKIGEDVIAVIEELTPEELQQMNLEDHALTRPPLPRFDATGIEKPEEPITDRTIVVPTFDLTFNNTTLLELSTGITSTITGLRYTIGKSNNDRAFAKCFPAVMIEAISVEDTETADRHNEIIRQLAACDTFESAVKILDTISDSRVDRLFFNRINRLLTQELNNVLVMNFGSFWMDDFYTDVMQILPAIAKKRGVAINQSFMGKQRQFFEQFIMRLDEKELEQNTAFLKEEYIDNIDENPTKWEGKFVTLPWQTSFTHLNLPSYELNIQLKPGETGVLSEKATPELWSLADQILNSSECSDARRHYLITEDGVQLLLARGYIREDAYLIRRVREVA